MGDREDTRQGGDIIAHRMQPAIEIGGDVVAHLADGSGHLVIIVEQPIGGACLIGLWIGAELSQAFQPLRQLLDVLQNIERRRRR